ncbi:SAM-dependent methyltransferase [Anabaena sp. UHCC 0451]|uniref:SAM-dependent methyltransferase n=1 Tax=Anabaena sp. UHCC 0451 TaxID=2055235 RepID=UPI002B1ECC0E|nr:methyltransferase domain-containing protein [Anabaena sp. UHCC 0451]MEA5576028.1 methyltransferase domain-containing protein [Anabaena sp. UHCC 0451]
MSSLKSEKVAEMYDATGEIGLYLISDNQLHFGYWDENNRDANVGEGAERLTQMMIDKSEILQGERFCDLGCGVGVPAMRIAKAKGCFVDGITISKYQCNKGKDLAEEAGMSDQVRFIQGNALEIPCDDAIYDGGWFFESIFYMGHSEALREAYRILKPGATLLIADLITRPNTTEEFKKFAKEELDSDHIPKEDYPGLLDEAGFDLIEIDDITEFVMPFMFSRLKAGFKQHEAEVLQYVKSEEINGWLQVFENVCDNLGYILVKAKKRVRS